MRPFWALESCRLNHCIGTRICIPQKPFINTVVPRKYTNNITHHILLYKRGYEATSAVKLVSCTPLESSNGCHNKLPIPKNPYKGSTVCNIKHIWRDVIFWPKEAMRQHPGEFGHLFLQSYRLLESSNGCHKEFSHTPKPL